MVGEGVVHWDSCLACVDMGFVEPATSGEGGATWGREAAPHDGGVAQPFELYRCHVERRSQVLTVLVYVLLEAGGRRARGHCQLV